MTRYEPTPIEELRRLLSEAVRDGRKDEAQRLTAIIFRRMGVVH